MDTAFQMARSFAADAIDDAATDRLGLFEVFDGMTDEIADEVCMYLTAIRKQVQQMEM